MTANPPSDSAPERQQQDEQPPSYDAIARPYAGISRTAPRSDAGLGNTEALRAAKDFAEMIVDTVRQGLLVLDLDLRIKTTNESSYQRFQVSPEQTLGRLIYKLGFQ